MKAQKLGLFLGMNMAVACMVMQGCKAVKPGQNTPPPAVDNTTVVAVDPAPATARPSTITVQSIPAETAPAPAAPVAQAPAVPAPVEPQPSQVAKVKPISAQAEAPKPVVKPVAAVSAVPAAATTSHTVARGDSLSGISKRYNVKMSAIVAANPGLNPDRIRIGQKIAIPSAAPAPVAVAAAPAPAKDAKVMPASATVAANTAAPVKTKPAFKAYEGPTKEYVVKNGETLGKIAYENGITIRALKALNGLQKDSVRVGQKLQVPAEKVVAAKPAAAEAKKPEVKPAAPAAKPAVAVAPAAAPAPVAEKPAAKPAEVAAPAPVPAPVAEKAEEKKEEAPVEAAAPAPAPAAGPTYTVKDGDDVVSVAINWGISPSQLMDLNDLKAGDPIKPGQVLKLPASAKQTAP